MDSSRSSNCSSFPSSTYRLQLNTDFTFDDAVNVVPYLANLGISAVYLSPIWAATPGSMHGYDVVDYSRINVELGGREAFKRLRASLDQHHLKLVLDFVPNHMGIGSGSNPWWQDVLENGRTSLYAATFDIDWQPLKSELRDQVLVPILGDYFGLVLERRELVLTFQSGEFTIRYHENPLPIAPPTYPMVLQPALERCEDQFEPDDLTLLEFKSIIAAFERLPSNDETDLEAIETRREEQLVSKHRLEVLVTSNPILGNAIDATIERFNGRAGDPSSFDLLEQLLNAQSYRPAFWRVAAEEINYRRFFAINQLAAIRQEIPGVFEATHCLLTELVAEGKVDGIRIDHPDGLWDPEGYFNHLAQVCPVWTVVEKILEPGESIPENWKVEGTVGYEFARTVTGLFVDSRNRKAIDDAYVRFIGERIRFHDLVYQKKQLIMDTALASETNVLARRLDELTEHNRRTRDFTLNSLRSAMREVIACFPIYRTYTVCGESGLVDRDEKFVDLAVGEALRRNPAADPEPYRFLHQALLMQFGDDATQEQMLETCEFVMKFQQLTGPVMAKGLEDTAFYIYNRLLSLNEVGGDPATFGSPVSAFHRECRSRAQRQPAAMINSSTHDTKRSEDARARISVITEMPSEWKAAANRWSRFNRRFRTRVQTKFAPHRNDEYHLYQTMIAIWEGGAKPSVQFTHRIRDYMIKVLREGQVSSSWISPNEEHESAMIQFVNRILDSKESQPFLEDFAQLAETVSKIGAINGLSQQVLKLTAPGVPDIYQGTEMIDLSLVDPDNRRAVDFTLRRQTLAEIDNSVRDAAWLENLLRNVEDGRLKLFVTASLLRHRRQRSSFYLESGYEALEAEGTHSEQVAAFRRVSEDGDLIVAVSRLVAEMMQESELPTGSSWGRTSLILPAELAGRTFTSLLTGARMSVNEIEDGVNLSLDQLFADLPVTVLFSDLSDSIEAEQPDAPKL